MIYHIKFQPITLPLKTFLFFFLLFISFIPFSFANENNLVLNNDMELDSGWEGNIGAVSNTQSQEQFYTGSYSRKVVTTSNTRGIKQNISMTVGNQYVLSAWVYPTTSGRYFIGLNNNDTSGSVDLVANSWQLIKKTVTYNGQVDAGIYIVNWWSGPTTFYVDNVSVKQYEQVTNSNMELDSDWVTSGVALTLNERSAEQLYNGTYSRKVVTNQDNQGIKQNMTLKVGTEYVLSAWIYPLSSGRFSIGLDSTDTSGNVNLVANSWQRIKKRITYTGQPDAGIHILNMWTSPMTFYVDNVSVIESVNEAIINESPVLSLVGDKSVVLGDALSFSLSASDADGDILTYSVSGIASTLLNPTTGDFQFTPDIADIGEYTATFTVTDGIASDSETITLSVNYVSDGIELVINGDMELDLGWYANLNTVSNTQSQEQFYAGTYSRKVVTTSNTRGIKQNISMTEGNQYVLSAWVYPTTPGRFFIGLDNSNTSGSVNLVANSWQEIRKTVTYNGQVNAGIYIVNWWSGPMTFYVDNVSVKQYEQVTNSDMELDSDWVTSGVALTLNERSTEQFYNGASSRKVVTNQDNQGIKQNMTLKVGTEYVLSAWIYPLSSGRFSIGLDSTDTSGNVNLVANSWQRIKKRITYTGQPDAGIHILNMWTSPMTFYVDNVSVIESVNEAILNDSPVLSLVGDKNINLGETLSFSLSASDADGDILTYSVSGITNTLLNTTTGDFQFTPDIADIGEYIVTFTVTDGIASDSETITLSVNYVSDGIELVINGDMELDLGWYANLNTVSNTQSQEQFYTGTYSRKVVTTSNTQGIKQNISLTVGAQYVLSAWVYPSTSGRFFIGLDNNDTSGNVDLVANSWQEIKKTVTYNGQVDAGIYIVNWWSAPITFYVDNVSVKQYEQVTNSDMELDSDWVTSGVALTLNERSTEQFYNGTYSRKVVTNQDNQGIKQNMTLKVGTEYVLSAWIYPLSSGRFSIGLDSTDTSDSVDLVANSWQRIKKRVTYTGQPDAGIYILNMWTSPMTFYVDNVSVIESVNEAILNELPVLSLVGDKSVNLGETLSFNLSASDADGDILTYSVSGIASTLLNPTTGDFQFTPDIADIGEYTLTFTVTDGIASDSETITLSVNYVSDGFELVIDGDMELDLVWKGNIGVVSNTQSQEQSYTGTYSRKVVTTTNTRGIKQNISLTVGNQYVLSAWVYPTTPGRYFIGLNNNDTSGSVDLIANSWQRIKKTVTYNGQVDAGIYIINWWSAPATFYVDNISVIDVINEPIVNQIPVLSSIGDKNVDVGATLNFTLSANDGDGDVLTYSVSGINSSLLDQSTGDFSFTPEVLDIGVYTVTFTVTDGIDFDSEIITVTVNQSSGKDFYVDGSNGDDNNDGTILLPLKTLPKALDVISTRVNSGVKSDKIYLRAGTYRNDGFTTKEWETNYTLYNINMKGTNNNLSKISAMPCPQGTVGCIQSKDGKWYENVIFDDGYTIPSGIWTQYNANIWKANPGYVNSQWGSSMPNEKGVGISWMAGANSDFLTLGPRLLLQDGEPSRWQDPWIGYDPLIDPYNSNPTVSPETALTEPGSHTYDQETGMLYFWPYNNDNPNNVKIETWKGTTPDIRFRHMFQGEMEYVEIKGLKFRLVTSILQYEDLGNYQNIKWEGNEFSYCWKHIFSDSDYPIIKDLPRNNWQVRYNVFYRPSREVFQIWGNNHVFEYNEIIEHGGPWAGGAAMVAIVESRHMRNVQIRYNYIRGQGNKWHAGSVFGIESMIEQRDVNGDCIFNGQTFEYNFFGDMDGGTGIYLGRGGCRMNDITIKNNVFAFNRGEGVEFGVSEGIRITSPHKNLIIENNVFYDQKKAIVVRSDQGDINLGDMANTISVSNNIFMDNNDSIPYELSNVATINSNLYFNNGGSIYGSDIVIGDPLFTSPPDFDFTLMEGSPSIQPGDDIGAYEYGQPVIPGTEWWIIKNSTSF